MYKPERFVKMPVPYLRLFLKWLVFALLFAVGATIFPLDSTPDWSADFLKNLLIGTLSGLYVVYAQWRLQDYSQRKNARWKEQQGK